MISRRRVFTGTAGLAAPATAEPATAETFQGLVKE